MKRSRPFPCLPVIAGALLIAGAMKSTAAVAAGSAEAGQAKAVVCSACHGVDGNSFNPEWPTIAGQNPAYFVRSLQAFKSGERQNVLMAAQVATLTDADMDDLAAFFVGKQRQGRAADEKFVRTGERIYRGGNLESGIGACIACHGPQGNGNGPAGYPAIGGQHAAYTAAQLRAYRSNQRSSDVNQMMRNNTARLTDAEIDALASYIQGLR
ncbi:MAG: cytochrome c4 [Gammaproteobacteria bacterium]|nr:cytochrome c4 [Gammaproteobacteria bacterium]